MRIHTKLDAREIYEAAGVANADVVGLSQHGSRIADRSFEVHLEGDSNRRPNSGASGAGSGYAATWDQWGAFLGALFWQDPDMLCGSGAKRPIYRNAKDFHHQTARRFDRGMPKDTHDGHRWEFQGVKGERRCSKCKAIQRWPLEVDA